MAFLSWRREYEVGVAQIDREHNGLFRLINEFHDAHAGGSSAAAVAHVLNRLTAYAEEHFQHEEQLMSDCAYPGLERHREMHAELVDSIFAINERLAADPARAGAVILPFIRNWLVGHIVRSDMDIGDFVRRNSSPAGKAPPGDGAAVAEANAAPSANPAPETV